MVYTFPASQPQVLEEPVYPAMNHHVKDSVYNEQTRIAMNNLYVLINTAV